ncbi:hypothetical protein B0T14DRAFT_565647 [Immersiella caudata]|uniref:Uncharacterized protein n=1 Tax=Immersiella caudata TaxID=314043 RepID=A0AA39WZB0_9PEZI|nr:hypothetical protein B0T14DRAFT_565647 [Immersiella caudata]
MLKKKIDHAGVCKALALDRFIAVQVQSGFSTLQELQTQLRPQQPTSVHGGGTAAGEAKNGVRSPQFLDQTADPSSGASWSSGRSASADRRGEAITFQAINVSWQGRSEIAPQESEDGQMAEDSVTLRQATPQSGILVFHSAEEAVPTRSRKPATPPASQPQTQLNDQTHALNGTVHPRDPSVSAGIALHQAVLPNGHTVTTAKLHRDRSPNRERREDNDAGLRPGDPIHVSSSPGLQTEMGLTLPELSGTFTEKLAALIEFGGRLHWPEIEFSRFNPGRFISGHILDALLTLDNQSEYTLGTPPERAAKITTNGIVFPYNVNDNHWVIAIIDKERKMFTSYGMTKEQVDKYSGAYQEAFQVGPLEVTSHDLPDHTGNTCALRCCDAFAKYLGIPRAIIQNELSLRLFYLQRLLQSRLHQRDSPPDTGELGVVTTIEGQPNEAKDKIGDDEPDEDESLGAERSGPVSRPSSVTTRRPQSRPTGLQATNSTDTPLPTGEGHASEQGTRSEDGRRSGSCRGSHPVGSLRPLPSPPATQPWSNGRAHTLENNANPAFWGTDDGTGGGNLQETPRRITLASPGTSYNANPPDPFELGMAQQLSLLSSASDLSMGIGGPNADGSADGHRPTTGTQTPNDTRRQLEPAEYRPGSGQAFASPENNPSLAGSVNSPTTVAAILELQLATGRDQRAGSQFQDLQQIRTSEPQSQSHPDEACSFGDMRSLLRIDHATQQEPGGVQPEDGAGAADSGEAELEVARQLSLLSQLPDAAIPAGSKPWTANLIGSGVSHLMDLDSPQFSPALDPFGGDGRMHSRYHGRDFESLHLLASMCEDAGQYDEPTSQRNKAQTGQYVEGLGDAQSQMVQLGCSQLDLSTGIITRGARPEGEDSSIRPSYHDYDAQWHSAPVQQQSGASAFGSSHQHFDPMLSILPTASDLESAPSDPGLGNQTRQHIDVNAFSATLGNEWEFFDFNFDAAALSSP